MGKTLVTGGTGFLGTHLVRALVKRGDEVRVAERKGARKAVLEGVDCEVLTASVSDRKALRRALKGVDRVFHAAGLVSMDPADRERLFSVNVTGTRNVLTEALEAGVERAVYVSSTVAIGPAERGKTADERQLFTAGSLGIPFVNAKHEAEVEAMRIAAHGLPLVCVNPAWPLGPGDTYGSSTDIVRRLLLGEIPAYVDGGLNVVDVRDVARGMLSADRKGKPGERYILGGRNFTMQRLFADIARIAGVGPPPLKVPARAALAAAEAAERTGIGTFTSVEEVKAAMQWWTYRNTKAKRDLDFKPRPHEETLQDTIDWWRERLGERVRSPRRRDLPLRVLGEAARLGGRLRRQ